MRPKEGQGRWHMLGIYLGTLLILMSSFIQCISAKLSKISRRVLFQREKPGNYRSTLFITRTAYWRTKSSFIKLVMHGNRKIHKKRKKYVNYRRGKFGPHRLLPQGHRYANILVQGYPSLSLCLLYLHLPLAIWLYPSLPLSIRLLIFISHAISIFLPISSSLRIPTNKNMERTEQFAARCLLGKEIAY